MLHLKMYTIFIYLVACFELLNAVLPEINDVPKSLFDNDFESIQYDPPVRLTQLKAIQLEGRNKDVKSISNIIHDEDNFFQQILKVEFRYDSSTQLKPSRPIRPENNLTCDNNNLQLVLNDLTKEVASLRGSLVSLKSELLESNNCSNIAPEDRCYEPASKQLSQKSPIGVNYDPKNKGDEESTDPKEDLPTDCEEVQKRGNNVTGIYKIRGGKTSKEPFMVLCDMETKGGGWTHIQKRFDGSQDFYLDFRDYKFGFGDLDGEFWLGLEHIYDLVGFVVNELLVEIVDRDNITAYAHYKKFVIGPEADGYPLKVLTGFSGDAGDSLLQHVGSKFSARDFDQDTYSGHCAQLFLGGWWYYTCHVSNLNGKFINAVLPPHHKFQGMHWLTYRGHEYCHAKARMMIRPARPL